MHADVFRFPEHPNLFAAVVGSGTQMTFMTFAIFGLALVRPASATPSAGSPALLTGVPLSFTDLFGCLPGPLASHCAQEDAPPYLGSRLRRRAGAEPAPHFRA